MKVDRIPSVDVATSQQSRQSRQALQMMDNRPLAIAQAEIIRSLSHGSPIQRAADITPEPRYPACAPRTILEYSHDIDNNRIIFMARPGFGQNWGVLNQDTYCSQNEGHTEPNLISRRYAGVNGNWNTANEAVDTANNSTQGRAPFTLYTEREPCRVCASHLRTGRYKTTDNVHWSIPYAGDSTRAITLQTGYKRQAAVVMNNNAQYTFSGMREWSQINMGQYGTPRLCCTYGGRIPKT